ncbi:MAG: putative metal-dependent hydrolase [Calditrichaeota bacterium]|nr:MAG: putative metal-dependent hydrolase [Calditrichota bacterium]
MNNNPDALKYPIGKFKAPRVIDHNHLKSWIKIIRDFPEKIKREVGSLSDGELEKRYRPGGWTIRQVVHHCADSHMNSFIRFKLTLTEETPVIKPYYENLWGELADSQNYPLASSLKILDGLHDRWTCILENLSEKDLERMFVHPETNEHINLKTNICIYAWHCEHHLAHIRLALNKPLE